MSGPSLHQGLPYLIKLASDCRLATHGIAIATFKELQVPKRESVEKLAAHERRYHEAIMMMAM